MGTAQTVGRIQFAGGQWALGRGVARGTWQASRAALVRHSQRGLQWNFSVLSVSSCSTPISGSRRAKVTDGISRLILPGQTRENTKWKFNRR